MSKLAILICCFHLCLGVLLSDLGELFQHRDMISTHVKFASALTKSVDTLVQEAKERLANEVSTS